VNAATVFVVPKFCPTHFVTQGSASLLADPKPAALGFPKSQPEQVYVPANSRSVGGRPVENPTPRHPAAFLETGSRNGHFERPAITEYPPLAGPQSFNNPDAYALEAEEGDSG